MVIYRNLISILVILQKITSNFLATELRTELGPSFQGEMLNTHGEHELDLTANQTEPENQAGPIPGPDHGQNKKSKFFFQKI